MQILFKFSHFEKLVTVELVLIPDFGSVYSKYLMGLIIPSVTLAFTDCKRERAASQRGTDYYLVAFSWSAPGSGVF